MCLELWLVYVSMISPEKKCEHQTTTLYHRFQDFWPGLPPKIPVPVRIRGKRSQQKRCDLSWNWSHYCCLYVICEGHKLVVWNHGILWLSHDIGNVIIQLTFTHSIIFQRGRVGQPPTRIYLHYHCLDPNDFIAPPVWVYFWKKHTTIFFGSYPEVD